MSHFSVFAIIPHEFTETEEKLEAKLDHLMKPYDEGTEVEPYPEECYCVGHEAMMYSFEVAQINIGKTIDQIRNDYWKMTDEERKATPWEEQISEYKNERDRLEKEHPAYKKPDPNCKECGGTGTRMTTYNPNSKWDWWQIGGRWSGYLTDYDPYEDPKNQETCFVCGGAGMRTDDLGIKMRNDNPEYKCNGCDGKGTIPKWPTQFDKYEGDIIPILSLREDKIPFAIITPEGEWCERGKMGWWAVVSGEKDQEDWNKEVRIILNKYMNEMYCVVILDCHI